MRKSPLSMVADLCHVVLSCFRGEKAKRRHAKIRQMVTFVFSHGNLSPRHTKVRHFLCVAFSHPVCRIFAWRGERSPRQSKIRKTGGEKATHEKCRTFVWRGERSPCGNTKKSPFGEFSRGAFSLRKHDNTTSHKSATIITQSEHVIYLYELYCYLDYHQNVLLSIKHI